MKTFSVGILFYKRLNDIIALFQCLSKSSLKFELILLNNDNIDISNEVDFINNNDNIDFKYIHHFNNYGVAKGRNIIIENSSNDILIFLDDDVVFDDFNNILLQCNQYFLSDSKLCAIAFKIISFDNKNIVKHEFPHSNLQKTNCDFNTYYIIGAGNAIRKEFLNEHRFPTDFGLYGMEEIDLSYRIINSGLKILYSSSIIIEHKRSVNGRLLPLDVIFRNTVNRCCIAIKYLKPYYIITCFIFWSCYYLKKGGNPFRILSAFNIFINAYKQRKPFDDVFYKTIKDLNGRIIY